MLSSLRPLYSIFLSESVRNLIALGENETGALLNEIPAWAWAELEPGIQDPSEGRERSA
jgi:hypothetical protein